MLWLSSFRYMAAFDQVKLATEMALPNRDLVRLLKSQIGLLSVCGARLL